MVSEKSTEKMDLTVDEDLRLQYRYLDLRDQTCNAILLVDPPLLKPFETH